MFFSLKNKLFIERGNINGNSRDKKEERGNVKRS